MLSSYLGICFSLASFTLNLLAFTDKKKISGGTVLIILPILVFPATTLLTCKFFSKLKRRNCCHFLFLIHTANKLLLCNLRQKEDSLTKKKSQTNMLTFWKFMLLRASNLKLGIRLSYAQFYFLNLYSCLGQKNILWNHKTWVSDVPMVASLVLQIICEAWMHLM